MSQRHVSFNVNELARIAAEAIGSSICVSVEKYPDGMYNKAMLLTMEDGTQVVAKVPNPNAGKPHFTTASEVATMDFARNVLGTPVPKVFAWSSKAEENPKAWTSISFGAYGGLYYAKDLAAPATNEPLYTDANGIDVIDPKFAIGPSTGRELIDNGRSDVEFDRGPWPTVKDYHVAIGLREMAAVKQLPQLPKSPITLCGPGTYRPTREKKLKALDYYLRLIPFLIPSDQSISSSHLWHGDLHVANIFVNPSKPTEIVGLIDWQSTELAPLYHHARQPQNIDYDGPQMVGLERPKLRPDVEELDPEERREVKILYLKQTLLSLYNTMTHLQNPRLFAALEFQQTTSHLLLLLARNLLIDGEASYLSQVAEMEATWESLPGAKGSPYPFSFSDAERKEMEADNEGVIRGMEAMRAIKDGAGELFPEQGLVRPELYQESLDALDALAQIKEQVIEEFAKDEGDKETWRKEWPFGT
ncbi:hypothetical protein B0J14DRAFT_625117 [Halenospora varia]|nr:hypothetical protein B0J14DRAFT_625117 [Halenospora varia]